MCLIAIAPLLCQIAAILTECIWSKDLYVASEELTNALSLMQFVQQNSMYTVSKVTVKLDRE